MSESFHPVGTKVRLNDRVLGHAAGTVTHIVAINPLAVFPYVLDLVDAYGPSYVSVTEREFQIIDPKENVDG